jgi:hypothetical protein
LTADNLFSDSHSFEAWRPVEGFSNYEVSNLGRVRKAYSSSTYLSGYVLKTVTDPKGYVYVRLYKRRQYNFFVHRLVAAAFIGMPPAADYQVNHKDGDKSNNQPHNLEWVTRAENMRHAVEAGLSPSGDRHSSRLYPESVPRGSRSGMSKLKEEDIPDIRRLIAMKVPVTRIAAVLGVTRGTIRAIKDGITWTHVP